MIGVPFNDHACLGAVTQTIADMVSQRDEVIAEIASRHPTTESLAEWIRSLPQRDDTGDKHDGPKVEACSPPQRLRIAPENPNCFERSATYVAIAELIDPTPVRQLATLDTPIGPHTFPVENGAPVILDPRVPRNALVDGLALLSQQPIEIEVHDAIEWTARLAEAGAAPYRNGPSRMRRARNALVRLVDQGAAPDKREIDLMGWMLALAERTAEQIGQRALAIVRTTALAVADLVDQVIARRAVDAVAPKPRNLAIEFGRTRLEPAPWLAGLARIAGHVGLDVGAVALRAKLATLGIGPDMFDLVEQELNREGLTMGPLARPPKLTTIGNFARKR